MAASLGHIIAGLLAGHLASTDDIAGLPDRYWLVFVTTSGAGLLMLLIARPVQRLMGNIQ